MPEHEGFATSKGAKGSELGLPSGWISLLFSSILLYTLRFPSRLVPSHHIPHTTSYPMNREFVIQGLSKFLGTSKEEVTPLYPYLESIANSEDLQEHLGVGTLYLTW
jgi:hypothetical protein